MACKLHGRKNFLQIFRKQMNCTMKAIIHAKISFSVIISLQRASNLTGKVWFIKTEKVQRTFSKSPKYLFGCCTILKNYSLLQTVWLWWKLHKPEYLYILLSESSLIRILVEFILPTLANPAALLSGLPSTRRNTSESGSYVLSFTMYTLHFFCLSPVITH